jgi:hypothetical protein
MPFALQQYLKEPMSPFDYRTLERAAGEIESLRSEDNLSQMLPDSPDFLVYALNAFPNHAKSADEYGVDPS